MPVLLAEALSGRFEFGSKKSTLLPKFLSVHTGLDGLLDIFSSPYGCLALYFVANLALTLSNKLLLIRFPFPWTLTALHALCGSVGTALVRRAGLFEHRRLSKSDMVLLVAFSTLYTVNIAASNLSLQLVTVPIHQTVRAVTPLITVALSVLFLRKTYTLPVYLSLLLVIIGVGFATYGDYYCTIWGLSVTVLGVVLAAVKGLATNLMQVGRLRMHPLDLLSRMCPLAFAQCVVIAWSTQEGRELRKHLNTGISASVVYSLFANAALAFVLNVLSFAGNKKNGPLTMEVANNVKQVLTIVLAATMFQLHFPWVAIAGIILTLIGGALYAAADLHAKEEAKRLLSPLTDVSIQSPPPSPLTVGLSNWPEPFSSTSSMKVG